MTNVPFLWVLLKASHNCLVVTGLWVVSPMSWMREPVWNDRTLCLRLGFAFLLPTPNLVVGSAMDFAQDIA